MYVNARIGLTHKSSDTRNPLQGSAPVVAHECRQTVDIKNKEKT